MVKIILPAIIATLLIVTMLFIAYQMGKKNSYKAENKIMAPVTESSTANWQTYTDSEAGFSLKYPDTVVFNSEGQSTAKPTLSIQAEKLADIPEDLPQLMGRKDALLEKQQLATGGGDGVIKIGNLNGQVRMTVAQFEICSVFFNRSLTFYPGDYRVIISLSGNEQAIMASMPEFFTVDSANCGESRIWRQDKLALFEPTLSQKKGNGAGQEWYNTFDEIVKTITLLDPTTKTGEGSAIPGWSRYTNDQYGFEISYPATYKALESAEDLYGYPNGIVLLYGGGQVYDIVIEAWDSQIEIEEKYVNMMKDVQVFEHKGKFISIFKGTEQAENDAIITSFTLL